jgi:tetratricopeptide (TPR) repeat protein
VTRPLGRQTAVKAMKNCSCVWAVAGFAAAVGIGCGGGAAPEAKTAGVATAPAAASPGVTVKVDVAARDRFSSALDAFNGHDKANDWTDATCAESAKLFEEAAAAQTSSKFPEATYDAGLAYQRCGNDKEAKAHFQRALEDEPKFHYARAQLALYQYKSDGNVDAAISALEQAVNDANFQNVPALVDLAMFQMQRDTDQVGANCHAKAAGKDVDLADFECAKLNLQRALAIDDGYMPAFNQLALYYFGSAKKKGSGGGKRFGRTIATNAALAKRGDVQQLELAALVCSQAVRKTQNYAPIHNTSGLILNELGNVNTAVKEFSAAASLDPHFFEAQMNLAAINLSFRGFDKAEAAYRKALEMHPNDYDAHLGLALALRGQIDDSNYDKQVAGVQAELDSCKKIDGARPDAYFNEGILTQEYKAKSAGGSGGTEKAIAVYQQAKQIFQTFIDKASGKSEYDGAVKKSKERMQDIDDTVTFLQAGGPSNPAATPAPAPPAGAGDTAAAPATSGAAPSAAPPASSSAAPPASSAAPPPAASSTTKSVPHSAPAK